MKIRALNNLMKIGNWKLSRLCRGSSIALRSGKIAFALFLFLFFSNSAEAAIVIQAPKYIGLTNGLVGYWSFNGNDMNATKALDTSGQGNHGTLTNGPTRAIGKIGQGLSFDGSNDYVDLPTINNSIRNNNTGTITAWIKIDTYTQYPMIFSHGDVNTTNYLHFNIAGDTDKLRIYWRMGADQSVFDGGTPINTGFWYHVAVTTNGSTYRLYVNGNEENLTTVSGSNTGRWFDDLGDSYPNAVGMVPNPTPSAFFDGILDDVRIYNRALSADEIKRLYKIGATLKINTSINNDSLTKGLVGYWSFDGKDMAANTAYDRSGNANTGTLTNGPTRTEGKIGQGLSFDGVNDYVNAGNNASLDLAGDFTIALWFKSNGWAVNSAPGFISKRDTYAGMDWELYYYEGGASVYFVFSNSGSVALFGALGVNPSANVWHHLLITRNGNSFTLWLDNVNRGTEVNSTAMPTGDSVRIGVLGGDVITAPNIFPGQIDDVRVYNRALTGEEIKRLYKIGATLKVNTSINNDTLKNGLVGYWSFDGKDMANITAYDRSGNTNTGTLTNGPIRAIGKIGQGLSFDGVDDYITAADSTSLDVNDYITVSAWVKASVLNKYILAKGQDNLATGGFALLGLSTGASLKIATSVGVMSTVTGTTALSTGVWYHIAATYDNADMRIYLNGAQDGITAVVSGLDPNNEPFNIGIRQAGVDTAYWNGLIDDVRIYNRALSADEIKRLYNLGR